jgi:hypothetical protein
LDVGFTRNFASSQAYVDRYKNNPDVIPTVPAKGLSFEKVPGDVYEWLGFEAYQLLFDLLDEIVGDKNLALDLFVYDFNEPDMLSRLQKIRSRLRVMREQRLACVHATLRVGEIRKHRKTLSPTSNRGHPRILRNHTPLQRPVR